MSSDKRSAHGIGGGTLSDAHGMAGLEKQSHKQRCYVKLGYMQVECVRLALLQADVVMANEHLIIIKFLLMFMLHMSNILAFMYG